MPKLSADQAAHLLADTCSPAEWRAFTVARDAYAKAAHDLGSAIVLRAEADVRELLEAKARDAFAVYGRVAVPLLERNGAL